MADIFTTYVLGPLFRTLALLSVFMHGAQHAHNDYNLQQATNKIPPSWSPANAKNYSFRMWLIDLQLWEVATDADPIRHGPMVALRLGGAARDMVREMDANTLANGRMQLDNNGNQYQQSGLQYLLQLLTARFAPLPQEVQLEAITELFTWRRQQNDTYDETITRYELMLFRLQNIGNIQLQPPIKTWMLLSALHVPRERWATLLFPTLGLLPQTAQEYGQFLDYLRRQGHLFDGTTDRNVSHKTYFGDDTSGSQALDWSINSWSDYVHPSPVYATVAASSDDEEEWSSGHSNCDEPIYVSSEIQALPFDQQGEAMYLEYRTHKRAFRHFSKSGPRRKGKGKGKGRKGKSSRKPMFYSDGSPVEHHDDEEVVFEAYYGGKGKGKSSGPRKNPRGSDGKIMTCSGCGSEDHFIRFCPKGSGKGKGKSLGKSGTSSSSTFAALPASYPGLIDATQEAPTRIYLSTSIPETLSANSSIIQFADGTSEVVLPASYYEDMPNLTGAASQDVSPTRSPKKIWTFEPKGFYPWWNEDAAFHAKVRLPVGEGFLIDCGAVTNLAGDRWVHRQRILGESHGQGTSITQLDKPGSVEGVGQGSSQIAQRAGVPICLASGHEARFETSVVTDSDLPALLGLESLERQGALIDCRNRKLIQVGPGGYKLQLSPNSTSHDLQKAPSGHLLLPCSAWQARKTTASSSTAQASKKPSLTM